MKKDKDKCKKGKESTIGKIIYGFLLFLPLMAIGVTCAYAIFNKNAYESYSLYQEEKIVNVSTNEQLQNGINYQINLINISGEQGYLYYVLDGQTNIRELYTPEQNYKVDKINLIKDTGRVRIQWFDDNNNQYNKFFTNLSDYTTPIWFVSNGNNTYGNLNNLYYSLTTMTYTKATLDNVFYYSVNKVIENPLFNWAQNSIIYTGMNEFTTSLSITNTFIPLLLTYWLIISLVYFIYDIVLIIFNVLHHKIHELQDSI